MIRSGAGFDESLQTTAETVILECRDGIRLQAIVNAPPGGNFDTAPLVVLIHGWLGRADSPYLQRAALALHRAGFGVARLLLRDHGGTSHLNPEMFNAGRIDEVVDACNVLAARYGAAGAGLLGFSLGGNFVLRVAAHPETSAGFSTALAVCPVLNPAAAVGALDQGLMFYQRYFLGKWRRAFVEKQSAFPQRYDFAAARRLSMVATLTDYFVSRHTPYRSVAEYYDHYTLTRGSIGLMRMPVRILATEDDPVVPIAHARALLGARPGLHGDNDGDVVTLSRHGGHCGFISDFRLSSALDPYAAQYFTDHLPP